MGKQEVLGADLVTAAERKNPRGHKGPRPFDDMLKKPCPYHQGPVKHALEDYSMLQRYYARLGLPDDDAKQKGVSDRDDDKDDGFPEVRNAFMIFGGPLACLTAWQRKRERREVFSIKVATPSTSTGLGRRSPSIEMTTLTMFRIPGNTHWSSTRSSATPDSPRC